MPRQAVSATGLQKQFSTPGSKSAEVAATAAISLSFNPQFKVLTHPRIELEIPYNSSVINKVQGDIPVGFETAGYGRIITFPKPQRFIHLVDRIKRALEISAVSVAVPWSADEERDDIMIRTVAVCPGSGGSMLGNLEVDLLYTGELGHHEALAAVEKGQCVITTFHSNSERGFLKAVMKPKLEELLGRIDLDEPSPNIKVAVSQADKDPFEVWN